MAWFKKRFGIVETDYTTTQANFVFDEETLCLVSKGNGQRFFVGSFQTPSVATLRVQYAELINGGTAPSQAGMTFQHIVADVKDLHQIPDNAGSVFQVASQMNCLEMPAPNVTPEEGITNYLYDRTQGPSCALMAPAATVYRNYLVNGTGQGGYGMQLNMLDDVEKELDNETSRYWYMKNGYCFPRAFDSIPRLNQILLANANNEQETISSGLKVGVHWSTEVVCDAKFVKNASGEWSEQPPETQRVCQVYCSGLPISYSPHRYSLEEWKPFATQVLNGVFEATVLVGAILAAQRSARVKVFLTGIGAGVFGNDPAWVGEAIRRALLKYAASPVDLYFVHFGRLNTQPYAMLDAHVTAVPARVASL